MADTGVRIRDYVRALFHHWWARVTGPLVTLSAIVFGLAGWPFNPVGWVLIGALVLVPAGYLAWRDEQRMVAALSRRLVLGVRLKSRQDPTTTEQVESVWLVIRNEGPGPAEHVKVVLNGINPHPRSPQFRGEFPQPIGACEIEHLISTSAVSSAPERHINEHQEEPFALLQVWVGSDGQRRVAGVFGLRESGHNDLLKHWRVPIERGERWTLDLTVSAANAEPQLVNVVVDFQGERATVTLVQHAVSLTLPEPSASGSEPLPPTGAAP